MNIAINVFYILPSNYADIMLIILSVIHKRKIMLAQ